MWAKNEKDGFTIVELLIVVVVIGILAAITIVAYNGIQKRAQTATVQSDLEGAAKQLAMDQVTQSAYPTTVSLANNGAGLKASAGTTYQYTVNNSNNPQTYCLTATNATTSYYVTNANNIPTSGACPGQSPGGTGVITNLATNPSAEINGGWLSNNVGAYPRVWDNTKARTGTYSISASNLSSSQNLLSLYGVGASDGNGFPIASDTTYTAAIYFTSDVAASARLYCDFRVGGTYTGGSYGAWFVGSVGAWSRASETCASPAGADMIRVGAYVNASVAQPSGTKAYVDDFNFVAGSSAANYADGNFPNWTWNGTPNASTSTGPPL